jgi:hypothetical protein
VLVSKEPPLKESVPPIPTTAQLSFLIAPNSLQSSKTGDSTVARARVFPATAASVVHAQLGLIDMNSLSSNPSSAVSKRQRGEEDEYIRYEYALPQTFAELEALFGSSPMLPTSSSGSSNRDLALVKEPGFFDDLPPLPDQKILTELVSRFFEDVFVAVSRRRLFRCLDSDPTFLPVACSSQTLIFKHAPFATSIPYLRNGCYHSSLLFAHSKSSFTFIESSRTMPAPDTACRLWQRAKVLRPGHCPFLWQSCSESKLEKGLRKDDRHF